MAVIPYNNIISRTDAAALIPEEVAGQILQLLPAESAALTLFRRVQMGTAQTRMPVLSALPAAYWVSGDTGLKQTTEAAWANKYLNVEELAAIVPIPEAVLDDADFDVWGEIRPLIVEAIGRKVDQAALFGLDKPASWPTAIVPGAIASANTVERGTNAAAAGGVAQDIADVMATVEADGYDVAGFAAPLALKARLRGVRTTDGQLVFAQSLESDVPPRLYGERIFYVRNGSWDATQAELIAGDFSQAILGVRQDITYKILDQAVIQDNTGAIVYNLAQQDMVAMRVVARFAYQVADPINAENAGNATRFPFGVLTPPTP